MDKKNELTSLMKELSSQVVLGDQKYFHTRTIENLIYHFDGIKSEADKQWVFDTLQAYFKDSLEISTSINRDISKNLYEVYIEKLTNYYHLNLGFAFLINRNVVYAVYIILLALGYFIFNIYVMLGLFLIFVISTYRTFLKYQERKVFAIYW